MLSNPDAKTLEALVNLEHNGNFKLIMAWINESKAVAVKQMAVAVDVNLYRAQGAFSVMESITANAQGARENLSKLSTGAKN